MNTLLLPVLCTSLGSENWQIYFILPVLLVRDIEPCKQMPHNLEMIHAA
jgi:hypothetical protein